jgi:translocation and assembly module TamB
MRRAGWIFGGIVLTLAGLVWLAGSPWALRLAAGSLERATGERVRVEEVTGSLYGPLRVGRLSVEADSEHIEATGLELDWRPLGLLQGRLEVTRLMAATLAVRQTRPSVEPLEPPASLRLPVALSAPEIGIGRLQVEASGVSLSFTSLRLALEKPTRRYRLRLVALSSPWGQGSGELELDEDMPYALHARLRLVQPGRYEIAAVATGRLTRLQLNLTSALPQRLEVHAVVTPFDPIPLQTAVLETDGLDPARWQDGWPSADLRARAEFSADREGRVQGRLQMTNARAGSLDAGRLPVVGLSGRIQGSMQALELDELALDLGRGGRLAGRGAWRQGALGLDLTTRDLDPRALHNRLRSLRLAGRIRFELDASGQGLDAQLAYQGFTLVLRATRRGEMLEVARARLTGQGGVLDLAGSLGLAAPHAFTAAGRLQSFDPSAFGDFPTARLNLRLQGSGQLRPQPAGRLEFELGASRWRGHPLSGGGRLHLSPGRLAQVDVSLALADNRLHLEGAYGGPRDRLDGRLEARRLDRIHPDLAGQVQAEGSLWGRLDSGSASLRVKGVDLRWGEGYRLAQFRAEADLRAGPDGRMDLKAGLAGLTIPGRMIEVAEIRAEGSRIDHRLRLSARGPGLLTHARLAGAWRQGWSGEILELEGKGRHTLRLTAPARLSWAGKRLDFGPADLSYASARIHLRRLVWDDGRLQTTGSFARLDPLVLPALARRLTARDSSLRLGGEWDLSAGDELAGTAALWRETGDLVLPTTPAKPVGLDKLRLELRVAEGWLHAGLTASGGNLGSMRAEAASRPTRRAIGWGLSGDATVTGQVWLDLPTLAWLGSLIDRRGAVAVDGRTQARLTLEGSVAQPRLVGSLRGEGLTLDWPELGLQLRQGVLQAELAGNELRLTRFDIQAGEGRLTARGDIRRTAEGARVDVQAEAESFRAMNLPTRQLIVSGSGRLTGQGRAYSVQGRLRAERARILLPRAETPTRSEDVVVLGREAEAVQTSPLGLELDLTLDLGPRFLIEGRGLDARLEGQLRVRSAPRLYPRANGSVRVAQGSYRAYGQRLTIERGVLDFQGTLDNPGLDILAMRTGQEVEAGVAITGTVLSPRARLISRPDVPDSEKLSWLVLGRGSESARGADLQLLSLAAGALLSAGESVALQAQIAQAIGLDEVGIKGQGSLEATVLTLGKRLSSRAYLSYEQGLAGLGTLVRLSYTLGRRWSVEAQTGRENTVDLFYTLEFD